MEIFLRVGLPVIAPCGFDLKKVLGAFLLFVNAAPFPHAVALAFVVGGVLLEHAAQRDFSSAKLIGGWLESAVAAFLFLFFLFAEADARSRYQNYLRVRDLLLRHGWNRRLIKPISRSRCQRDAILLAAEKAGYREEVARFYRDLGYRWFHLIPDTLLEDPRHFFTSQFIQSSFFVRSYRRRHPVAPNSGR